MYNLYVDIHLVHKRKKTVLIWSSDGMQEPQNHLNDCYFCAVKTTGLTSKTRSSVEYPSLPSAVQPVPHSVELSISTFYGFQLSDSNLYLQVMRVNYMKIL